mgnify:CR=1 FL=1
MLDRSSSHTIDRWLTYDRSIVVFSSGLGFLQRPRSVSFYNFKTLYLAHFSSKKCVLYTVGIVSTRGIYWTKIFCRKTSFNMTKISEKFRPELRKLRMNDQSNEQNSESRPGSSDTNVGKRKHITGFKFYLGGINPGGSCGHGYDFSLQDRPTLRAVLLGCFRVHSDFVRRRVGY